ncbi:MAG TPA: MBL fold metallo-hydrolase [Candidatus Ruthenibacterium merdavium]|uniref:MBL fold metallo-hydrolase n=1 Tax=Candidatus Ruthenibacterium merdavium TaxID=2838752 RepID=A0A9D2Q2B0_9FIRM|nr:MBL fold metallo-hydrolase [Candidatus Ruthenibacterium merdavium]
MDPFDIVRFVSHGSICLSHDDVVIYIDPYRLEDDDRDADLIILTHSHPDHYSPADIARVLQKDTCFVATPEVARLLVRDFEIDPDYLTEMMPGSPTVALECGATMRAVVAENKNHPEGFGFGVLLSFAGIRWYISGDTDVLDEDVRCDVLFVCCDGVWNMPNPVETASQQILAMEHRPKLVIPYHYGAPENPGTEENGKALCSVLEANGISCRELIRF